MALRAILIDASTGKPYPQVPALSADPDVLKTLFAHPEISEARFPLLCRLRDQPNQNYANAEMENLFEELGKACVLIWAIDVKTPLARLLDQFNNVVNLAWCERSDLTLSTE